MSKGAAKTGARSFEAGPLMPFEEARAMLAPKWKSCLPAPNSLPPMNFPREVLIRSSVATRRTAQLPLPRGGVVCCGGFSNTTASSFLGADHAEVAHPVGPTPPFVPRG